MRRLTKKQRTEAAKAETAAALNACGGGVKTATKNICEISFRDFCKLIGFDPTPDQRLLALLSLQNRYTNAVSAHGTGKSHVAAAITLWATLTRGYLVATSAPTARQVKYVLWRLINEFFARLAVNPALRRVYGVDLKRDWLIGQTFLRFVGGSAEEVGGFNSAYDDYELEDFIELIDKEVEAGNGMAFGFSGSDSTSVQGLHAPKLLVILDEVLGISDDLLEGVSSLLTGSQNHLLSIGNPTARGAFHANCRDNGGVEMSGYRHPNTAAFFRINSEGQWEVTDETAARAAIPAIPGAISPEWILDAVARHGAGSLYDRCRIQAKFPQIGEGAGSLIPIAAVTRSLEPIQLDAWQRVTHPLFFGVDIGETGDSSVIVVGQFAYSVEAGVVRKYLAIRGIFVRPPSDQAGDGLELERVSRWAIETIAGYASVLEEPSSSNIRVTVDATGIGAGVAKDIKLALSRYPVEGVQFGAGAVDRRQYANARAEIYGNLATLYTSDKIRYDCPDTAAVNEIHRQLGATGLERDGSERVKVVAKDQIKLILGCSPDLADALGLAAYGLVLAGSDW